MEIRNVPAAALRCTVGPFELGEYKEGNKSAPFKMVARTGDSLEHWYWGKVVHDLAGMNIHKQKLAIDYVHDDKEIIGYANRFETDTGDLVASGALVPYKENDRASEIIHKADAGVPYEASINFGGDGIKIEEYGPDDQVEVNGRDFAGPVTVIREWPLRGIAVCPYGADMNTSTEFNNDKREVTIMDPNPKELAEYNEVLEEKTDEAEAAADNDIAAEAEPAVEAVPTEAVEATAEVSEQTQTGQDFLDRFGDQGGVWFAQGKDWDECVKLHEQSLVDRIKLLEQQVAEVGGESEPVNFNPEPDSNRPKNFQGRIRIQGKKYE